MLWLGLAIGFSIGVGYMQVRYTDHLLEFKRLEREIQADLLEIAREERRAAALRVIANNEAEAMQNREGTDE